MKAELVKARQSPATPDNSHQTPTANNPPDIKNGAAFGMPLQAFVDETWEDLVKGQEHDEYPIGMAKHWYNQIEPIRHEAGKILPMTPANVDV
jgi:hypothetical protein